MGGQTALVLPTAIESKAPAFTRLEDALVREPEVQILAKRVQRSKCAAAACERPATIRSRRRQRS